VNDRPCRLAILASHPIQYFTPLYRRLAARPGLSVDVMYYRDFGVRPRFDRQFGRKIQWDTDQLSGYRHRFLWNASPITDTFNPLHALNPGAFVRLLRGYDAVWLNGYTYPSNWLALAAAALRGTRVLLRSELRADMRNREGGAAALRDRIVRWWVRRADALLYIGRLNRDAYLVYGARPNQLFPAPYSVDVDLLRAASRESPATKQSWRREFGLPQDRPLILFAGKLTERKHPEALLHAIRTDAMKGVPVHLVYAGSGPLEANLHAMAADAGITNVSMLGFVNQSALPRLYALADIFVFPSENEPYGLALNEAMAAGAAPVATTEIGAAADLITDGVSGFLFPARDWTALGQSIARLLGDAVLRARVANAAVERASAASFDATVEGIISALSALGVYHGTMHNSYTSAAPYDHIGGNS
jgi:glycosyltransferase involved in cell wall biosynthesis